MAVVVSPTQRRRRIILTRAHRTRGCSGYLGLPYLVHQGRTLTASLGSFPPGWVNEFRAVQGEATAGVGTWFGLCLAMLLYFGGKGKFRSAAKTPGSGTKPKLV